MSSSNIDEGSGHLHREMLGVALTLDGTAVCETAHDEANRSCPRRS
jgi:hypothetical protein